MPFARLRGPPREGLRMIPAFEPVDRRDAAVRRGSAGTIHMASRAGRLTRVRREQANIYTFKSKEFVRWVAQNIDAPLKRGPGGKILEKVKGGLVGEFFNWAQRNSTGPLHFGIMCCAIEMAATSDPRYDVERFGGIYRSSPRQVDVLLLNGPISLQLRH